jgi:hypothetical protein
MFQSKGRDGQTQKALRGPRPDRPKSFIKKKNMHERPRNSNNKKKGNQQHEPGNVDEDSRTKALGPQILHLTKDPNAGRGISANVVRHQFCG